MIKAVQMIFTPFATWQKISLSERGGVWALIVALLPWVAIGAGVETYGLIHWGNEKGEIEQVVKIPEETAVRYGAAQAILLIAGAGIGAQLLAMIVASFGVRTDFSRCLIVTAYALTLVAMSRMLDAVPAIPTWICWGIGVLLSISTLYHGVGLVLKPEQTKGFGLFMLASVVVAATSGIAHALALAVLSGRILK